MSFSLRGVSLAAMDVNLVGRSGEIWGRCRGDMGRYTGDM